MIHAEEIVKVKKQVIGLYMKHTGMPYKKLGTFTLRFFTLLLVPTFRMLVGKAVWLRLCLLFAEDAMERDRFLSPADALQFGIIDKILQHPPQEPAKEEEKDEKSK